MPLTQMKNTTNEEIKSRMMENLHLIMEDEDAPLSVFLAELEINRQAEWSNKNYQEGYSHAFRFQDNY